MFNLAAVFLGGGIGAVARYLIAVAFKTASVTDFPLHTLLVNIVGSFLIGFFAMFFLSKPEMNTSLKFFLTAGFCGGLTTFSSFSLESIEYLKVGKFSEFFIYISISILVCLVMAYLGAYFAKHI